MRLQGSNYKTIKRRILRQNLSTFHFNKIFESKFKNTYSLDKILIENSSYGSTMLKKRLLKENLLLNKCVKCGLEDKWKSEPITLQLDHINGNHTDNRIDNLRILCPNCHSQTKTHSGKRLKRIYYCPSCNSTYAGYGKICLSCHNKQSFLYLNINNIKWPGDEELKSLIWKFPLIRLSKQLKCSSNGIKMHCFKHKILLPPQGYWQRIASGHSPEQSLLSVKKTRIPLKKWTQNEVDEMKKLKTNGINLRDIGIKFGIAHTTVGRLIKSGGSERNRTVS